MPRESFSCQAELDCAQWPNGQRSGLYRGWFQFNSTRSKESQYLPSLICHLYRIGLSILSFLSKALIIFHPHFHCPSCLLYLFPTAHLRGLSYSPRQPFCLRFHSRISLSLHLSVFNFYCSHFSYLLFIDLWETMDYSGFEHQATRWKAQNDPLSNLWWPSQHLFVKLRIALFFAPFRLSLSFIFYSCQYLFVFPLYVCGFLLSSFQCAVTERCYSTIWGTNFRKKTFRPNIDFGLQRRSKKCR